MLFFLGAVVCAALLGVGMVSLTAVFGLASFGGMLVAVSIVLRQLGAGDAAKGLMALTGVLFLAVLAATYVPTVIAGF